MTFARSFPCAYDKGIPVAVDPRLKKKEPPTCPRSELPTPPNSAVEPPINTREKRSISPGPDLILHKKAKSVLLLQSPSLISSPIKVERKRPANIKVPSRPSPPAHDEPSPPPPPPRDETVLTPDISGTLFDPSPRLCTKNWAKASAVPPADDTIVDVNPLALAAKLASLAPVVAKLPTPVIQDVGPPGCPPPALPPAWRGDEDIVNVEIPQQILPTILAPTVALPPPQAPEFPLDAIETLQHVASDLISILINKSAEKRERQLMQAVGTIRTCLEVEFAPHMEAWKQAQLVPAVQGSPPSSEPKVDVNEVVAPILQATGNPSDSEHTAKETKAPRLSIVIPGPAPAPSPGINTKKLESAAPFGITSSREALKTQLAGARTKMDKLEAVLKGKDEEIDGLKERIARLVAQAREKEQEGNKVLSTSTTRKVENITMGNLQRELSIANNKIIEQKHQIIGLVKSNCCLKKDVEDAGSKKKNNKGVSQGPENALTPGFRQDHWQSKRQRTKNKSASQEIGSASTLGSQGNFWKRRVQEHLPMLTSSTADLLGSVMDSSEGGGSQSVTAQSSTSSARSRASSTSAQRMLEPARRDGQGRYYDPRSQWERDQDTLRQREAANRPKAVDSDSGSDVGFIGPIP